MLQDLLLPFCRRAAVAAHGGEDERPRALALEPAAEFPGQNFDAGNAAAADRNGDALIA